MSGLPLPIEVASRTFARWLRHGLAVAMGLVLAADAIAAAPDADELTRLQATMAAAKVVRVTGSFGTARLRDVELDSTGVISARWGPGTVRHPALIVGSGIAPPPRPSPIAWDDISRIEVGRTRVFETAAGLGTAGALLGWAVWATIPLGHDGGRGPAPVVIGVPAVTGLLLGALLGAESYRWTPVYPRGAPLSR